MAGAALDHTHDPSLQSWVPSARSHPDFPIQNLPFGVFRRVGSQEAFRGGVAIGDQVIDLQAAAGSGAFTYHQIADRLSYVVGLILGEDQ